MSTEPTEPTGLEISAATAAYQTTEFSDYSDRRMSEALRAAYRVRFGENRFRSIARFREELRRSGLDEMTRPGSMTPDAVARLLETIVDEVAERVFVEIEGRA